jgi:hypothetical protein
MLMATTIIRKQETKDVKALAHCPICTHSVPAVVTAVGKKWMVKPNQRCPRCQSSLDAGYVLQYSIAA